MILVGEHHEVVMMDAIHFGWLKGMDDQMARCSLKKTGDGKKELFVHSDPFGDLFFVLVIKDPGHSFFNEINIVCDGMFAEQEMILGDRPVFPGIQKNIPAFQGKRRYIGDSFF